MQNKPNLLDAQMNVSYLLTKHYENEPRLRTPPKQTQIKPNLVRHSLGEGGFKTGTYAPAFDD